MIVNAKDILKQAKENKYAIPHFNTNNLEWTKFILEECNSMNSPVIIGVSESSIEYMGGYEVVSNLIMNLDKSLNINVPVVIHLDHGSSVESAINAINAGFTSVMLDASKYNLEKNIEMTKKVVEYAKKFNVTVEAEIGAIGGKEDQNEAKIIYATKEDAVELVEKTGIDSLAPAVGNIHGIYNDIPNINFNLIKEISDCISVPLVLHGASGLNDNILKEAIKSGITKININTDLNLAWSNAVRLYLLNNKVYDVRKIIKSGEEALKEAVRHKIIVLRSNII